MFKKILIYILIGFIAWKVFTSQGFSHFANNNDFIKSVFKTEEDIDTKDFITSLPAPKSALHCYEHLKLETHDRAASCYKQELINNKNNPEIYYYLAYSYYKNRNYQSAIYYADYLTKYYSGSIYTYHIQNIKNKAKRDLEQKENLEADNKPDYYDEIESPKHWAKTPITVWIEPGHNTANLFNAFSNWQNALYPIIAFKIVQRQEDANIAVIFDDPRKYCRDKRVIGCAKWWVYSDDETRFYNAKIYLTRYDSRGTRFSDTYLYSILCHEIGHAIGIDGHSKNKSDVMYKDEGKYNTRPTARDIRTIKRIYGAVK